MVKFFNDLPLIAKVLLEIFLGSIVSGLYRIFKYLDSKNTTTLVAGILAFVPPVSFIIWILDLISIIKQGKITNFAD